MMNKNADLELCLCYRCASVYFNDPNYYIIPKEKYQLVTEQCEICKKFGAKDFKIWKKMQSNKNT